MLRPRRKTAMVASASLFAALYAVLGAIPVSRLVLGSGFLTASNIITPLAGMLFGPVVGSGAALIGDFIDLYAGQLSSGATALSVMAADLAVVATAGLAFSGKTRAALFVPFLSLLLYTFDPLSVQFVGDIPFAWLHILSFAALAVAVVLEARRTIKKLSPVFIVIVTFASLMCGQLVGTIVGQNLLVRVYGVYTVADWKSTMNFIFAAYPVERIFFGAVGSVIAIPVLRSVSGWEKRKTTASG